MSHHFYYHSGPQAAMTSRSSMGPSSSSSSQHNHHHNHHNSNANHRARRSTRYNAAHAAHKQYKDSTRPLQNDKEPLEAAMTAAFRKEFEAARSFDLEDDEIFCPWHLLTEDDLHSIHSASSDRSSSSGSDSPDHSPLQHQIQPTPTFSVPPTSHHAMASVFQPSGHQFKIHAPQAQRARNAIPIVDPNSRHTSPPNSISPARQAHKTFYSRRW